MTHETDTGSSITDNLDNACAKCADFERARNEVGHDIKDM
jgi:hypothetical protein